MDNKLSELSKPVAWVLGTPSCKHLTADAEYADWYLEHGSTAAPLYSQEYVSALLAELEAKDKRLSELERANKSQDDHINQQQDRIESLEKKNGDLGRSLGAAEKRLATPVQLQNCDFESVAIMAHWCTDEQLEAWVKGVEHAKKQIRAAGFKVEGDE